MTSSRPSEQIRSSSCLLSETSDGESAPTQRNQLSSDPVNSPGKNVAPAAASCLTRQPGQLQSRPRQAQTVHQPLPEKQKQIRPQGNVTKAAQVPQAVRMTSPANLQTARHGLRHPKLPQLAVSSCAPQRQQQQQNVQNKQQQQRPASSDQPRAAAAAAVAVSQGKRMDTANFIRPSIQAQTSHQQNPPQGLNTEQISPNKIRESGSTNNKTPQPQPASRVNFPQNAARPLPPQSQFKVFSAPQNQGPHPYRPKPGDVMPLRHPPEYDDDDDDMFDDEEDGAYDEEIDDEEMHYTGFPNSFGYNFNSSDDDDDDELSEEESALLEELRVCDDEVRYNDIIRCLHEKGIESEEIEELLNPSSHPLDMYSRESFPGGDQDEAEGTVSSSSQSHLPPIRHHPRVLPAPGHAQPVAALMPAPQAAGFIQQTGPSSIPATSSVGRGQQRMIPRHLQQPVSGPSHAQAAGHPASQGQPVQQRPWGLQQQLDLKLTGQPKKIFQNSPSQLPSGALPGKARQPQGKEMVSQPLLGDSDSPGEDVRQAGNIDEQSCKEINTSQAQLQTEETRLPTGRNNIKVTSGPVRVAAASSKADENQTCSRPLQQRDVGQKHPDEQGAFVGPSLVQPTGVRGPAQKIPPHGQAKLAGAQGPSMRAQLEDPPRPGKSVSNSAGVHPKLLPSPELKAALQKNTSPSEASLARLNVEYMQQSLDQEIKAKKTVSSPPAHLSGHKHLNIRHPHAQHRHASPLYMNRHPPGRPHPASHLHSQPASPASQPKHQLPPRQPIPAIINPNSNVTVASSTGKPVCSVVPFTPENQAQAVSTNVPKANSAPPNETFIRPQNPLPAQPQDLASSLPQSPGLLQTRPKSSALQSTAPPAAPSPSIALSKSGQPGKTTSLSPNQPSTPSQTQPAQPQALPAPSTQPQQTLTQTQQPPTQTQQPPTQTQQPPTQTQAQQTPTHVQLTPTPAQPTPTQVQIQQPPTQAKPTPTQAQLTPTQAQPTPTQVQAQQPPTQAKQAQVQSAQAQAQQPPAQTQQPPTQPQQPPTQTQQTPTQPQQTHTQTQQSLTQTPTQVKQAQVQPAQAQTQQNPSQTQHTPTQAQQTPTQAQQTPTQTQQTPTQAQQTPTQTQHTPTQAQQTPTQTQQTPTQAQQTPTQAHQTPTQAKQAQVQPGQAHPPHAEATLPSTQTQPAQAKTSKADSFSVDRLSKDKCVITGKGKNQSLVANMVYQIRSPIDGSFVLALWNGDKFEDLKQSGKNQSLVANMVYQIRSPIDGSFVLALWKGDKFEDLKQTGLTTTSGGPPGEKTRSEAHKVHTGQSTSGGAPSSQATYVKPLAPAHAQHRHDHTLDNCDDDDDEDGDDNDDDSVFKKPFVEQPKEAYCRVCPFCGFTSTDMKRCESCRRIFRGDIKVVHINRQTSRPSTVGRSEGRGDPQSVPSAHKEHVGQVAAVNRVKGGAKKDPDVPSLGQGDSQERSTGKVKDEDDEDSDSEEFAADAERPHDSLGSLGCGLEKRPAPGKAKDVAPRKRQRRIDDPVTVTISSDEDEPSSTSSSLSRHALSPTSHAGSKPPSFLFPPPRPVKSFGKLRPEPPQDEEQDSKLDQKGQPPQLPRYMYGPGEAEEDDDEDEDGEMDRDEDEEPPMYEIDIRSVRVGSMRTQPEGPLLISLEGVCIKVRSERTEEIFDFEILAHEVEKVRYFLGEIQPVLYLFVSQDCGEKMRSICHMEPGDEEFFDPSSTDMKQKMIVVIIEGFSYMSHEMLRETLSLWADLNQVEDDNFIEELTDEQSNDLLIQSAPPVLTMDVDKDLVRFRQRNMKKMALGSSAFPPASDNNDNEPDSTSGSPPEVRCHYYGSSIRLLQYPPPPAKRLSITTEDLFCLTEGEFLNDVIIDFYLQAESKYFRKTACLTRYLYLEKLSEENRRRTHIFSSFFYKRLMQKDRHDRPEEDAKKSLPDRRHARVKKWTKKVDLFSKDFIVIPINENSHWYLAVICFPGLGGPEAVQYIPSAAHMEDLDVETSDVPGGTEGAEERASQGSAYRTILGQQLEEKQRSHSTDIKPLVGQKQPCILMFDSLAGPSRIPNVRILREYLQCEWNAKKSEPRQITKILRSCTPDVPQQSNFSDCGVYLLQYVESFFEDPIGDFEIPMEGLEHWFPEEIVHNKRREIHELIMSLHRQYQMERGDPNILYLQFESTPREGPTRFYPDYDGMSGHEEEMNYEANHEMMSEMDEDMNYDASYEMAARLGEDMNYDPNYEMPTRPDQDGNYEATRDHENSNSGFSEEADVGEDAPAGVAVEDKG